MNTHEEIKDMLAGFALGELSTERVVLVESHISECQECSKEVKKFATILECTGQMQKVTVQQAAKETSKESLFAAIGNETINADTETKQISASIWRIIMKSKITKFAAAAVIIIAILIGINQFGGSIDGTTIAFAQVIENMKKMPWMHVVGVGVAKGITGTGEQWIGFEEKKFAYKGPLGEVFFLNIREHKKYEYDPEKHIITIDYAYEEDMPLNLSSPVSFLENMHRTLKEHGVEITIKQGEYNGRKVQIQEISMSSVGQNNENHLLQLYIESDSKLMLAARVTGVDSEGNTVIDGEAIFSYPQVGPADIYDLGVRRDAQIISKLPEEDYQMVWDNYRQSRAQATQEYIAVITHSNQRLSFTGEFPEGIVTMIDVDYNSDRKKRLERHFVFNTGQVLKEFWPGYKEQLGDTFESLLGWTKDHYDNPGSISVYFYDGQYYLSTRRDEAGDWSKAKKRYTPDDNLMPNMYLGCIGWPGIYKSGHIIEDDYASENNLICIERLQQGIIHQGDVSLPGRFLFYLDPQRDYLCVRYVHEWRPDAEWQEDKDWLRDVEPDKISEGSITVKDITETIQASNGYWYPRVIVEKTSGVREDYKDAALRVSDIQTIYVQTEPEFPEGIFDLKRLPK